MKFTVEREEIRHIIIGLTTSLREICTTDCIMPAITLKTLAKLAYLYNRSIREETVSFELTYIYAMDLKVSLGRARKYALLFLKETWFSVDNWHDMLKEALESWRD